MIGSPASVALVVWLVLVLGVGATADSQEEDELEEEFAFLEEENVVFAPAKHEQDIAESPSAITIITREQIENTHCTDVVCLLRQVPEVDVKRVKPLYSVVGARALTDPMGGEKALVLVDGQEVNYAHFVIPNWDLLPVHLEDIERIEVIRGPGSALYGANAYSIVVSISTIHRSDDVAAVFLGGGEHDSSGLYLRLGYRLGDWRLRFSSSHETNGNWKIPAKREREVSRLLLRLDRDLDSSDSTLQIGLVTHQGLSATAIGPVTVGDGLEGDFLFSHRIDFLQARLSGRLLRSNWFLDLPLSYQGSRIGKFPENMVFFIGELDAEAQVDWSPFSGNLLIAGANYRWIFAQSGNAEPEEGYEHRVGVFLQSEQRLWDELILTGSIRFDYNSITPFTVSPRLAAVWRASADQLLRLAFARAFRKPSLYNTWLHFKGVEAEPGFEELEELTRRSIGNKDLDNESITVLESGYRGSFIEGQLTAEADVFYNRYRDTINFYAFVATNEWGVPDLGNSVMRYRNTGREADAVGGTVSLTYRIREVFRLNANYTYRYSWFTSGAGDMPSAGQGGKGKRVGWEPAHLANFTFYHLLKSGLRWGLSLHGFSSSDFGWPRDGNLFNQMVLVHQPASCFVNGFLAWRVPTSFGWAELGIRAFDIFDTPFRDTTSTTRPDGVDLGGELLSRRIFVYLRGVL